VSGALAFDAAWLFAGFLILAVLLAAGITVRRILLDRGGGTVECGLRLPEGSWRLGVAAYQQDELRWYHVFGVLLTPDEVFERRTLTVVSRRVSDPVEAASLGEGTVVVECHVGEAADTVELAMGESALTGFLAWLEAAPPGQYLGQVG
jgi:Protein of unknown function (DUF2550)